MDGHKAPIFTADNPGMKKEYLLHVDDDPDDRDLVRAAVQLINLALEVRGVANGSEALAYLHSHEAIQNPPRLILLDLNMPVMSGYDTLVALKNDPATASLPVYVFTTSSASEDQRFCRDHQVELINKPSRFEDLKNLLLRIVNSSRSPFTATPGD